jgi:hypothetical protein
MAERGAVLRIDLWVEAQASTVVGVRDALDHECVAHISATT